MSERQQIPRDEATRLIAALIDRHVDGELPALASAGETLDVRDEHARLPLSATLPLQARALFASSSLSPEARQIAAWTRNSFFSRLGAPFGMSARTMLAAVRTRKFPPAPPRQLEFYEYIGAFTCGGQFDIADPCHLRRTSRLPAAIFSLSFATEALPGQWHAYVRTDHELVVVHADGFDAVAGAPIASIGVDAGMVGVFDSTCPVPADGELYVEGTVHGLGAFAFTGGDSLFPVFAGSALGRIAKLRIAFHDERPELDTTVPRRASRRYAASVCFAPGDELEHPKFGVGSVIRALDGKIDVAFADEIRTLVHDKR